MITRTMLSLLAVTLAANSVVGQSGVPAAVLLAARSVVAAAEANAVQGNGAAAGAQVQEIIVVIKTHFDIGYTHRVGEIVHHYRTGMIDKAMDIMDQSKTLPPDQQFVWTGPGWVMSKVLEDWPGQTPERRKRLDDYVRAGKFQFHALPFTLESDACEPEAMARGLIFSSKLCRQYGMPLPVSGKKTDVPSHGGALSTVLAHGGVKFMHIGCNWPSGYVKTPGLFWWEGPDGSRVLTLYSSTYGTATGIGWPEQWGGNEFYIGREFVPPPSWPYKVWPAIIVTLDNTGPPTAEAVRAAFEDATRKLPGVRIRMGTMDDFVEALLKDTPRIPVVKGEMPDTWIHGIMSDPDGIKLSRAVHPQLASAEALHTQLKLWGTPQPDIAMKVALAYEKILLYGEHTWGRAPQVGEYGEAFKRADPQLIADLEASWEDKTNYIREAAEMSSAIAMANLRTLAENVEASAGAVIVYNPLPWPRSGTVEMGKERYSVLDVPPCGYLTVSPRSAIVEQTHLTGRILESRLFKLTIDPAKGAIASLVDKRSGREWVDASAEHKLGQYLNERFTFEQTFAYTMTYQQGRAGDWPHHGMHKGGMVSEREVPYRAALSARGRIAIDGNSAVIECPAAPADHMPASTLRITLHEQQPCIDLELTIRDKAKDNWPEADWLCLPFKIDNPRFQVHRPLGVMDPATDILPGANRDLFSVGHGVTIAGDDGAGIAVCPIDHPLVSLDRPGCWKASKSAEEFTPKKPVVYLNLYNNQWNTNFRYWYPGSWSSRVRLWTFDAKTPADAVLATSALEARNPLQAVAATGRGNKLPPSKSGISVSRQGVLVTAFGANPDGEGTLLRVWEMAGVSGDLTVTIPGSYITATPVNFRGERSGNPIPFNHGKLTFPLKAYSPASFIVETCHATAGSQSGATSRHHR